MIVMLALLNDGAILSIAYDNVRYKGTSPSHGTCAWCLGVATVLGIIGGRLRVGFFISVSRLSLPTVRT